MGASTILRLAVHPMVLVATAIILFGAFVGILIGTVVPSHDHDELLMGFCLMIIGIALPLVCALLSIAGFALITWFKGGKLSRTIGWAAVFVASSMISLALLYEADARMNNWKALAAIDYVSRAIPILQRLYIRDGSYPTKLPVVELGSPPALFRDHEFGYMSGYWSDGTKYQFKYLEPSPTDLGSYHIFDSTDQQWTIDH